MIWNLPFSFWVGSISPVFGFPRSSVVHPSPLSCLGSQQAGTRDEALSPCAHHLQSRGASSARVPQRRSSARWRAVLVSVRSPEELFLSCFQSPASPLWRKGKTSTLRRRGTCRSSSLPAARCCSGCWATWATWATWGSCCSAPAGPRHGLRAATRCESPNGTRGCPQQHLAATEVAQAFQSDPIDVLNLS